MSARVYPWQLSWGEVDPARHPFALDEDGRDELAAAVLALQPPAAGPPDRYEFGPRVTELLVGRYGAWACGWDWAVGEGGGGGPVQSWCCPAHSLRAGSGAAARTVVASLLEWREWLERLAERFAELVPPPGATAPERSRAVQRAAVRLVTVVVDATQAEDAWYALCERTLTWYLDAAGIAGEAAAALVDEAIGGRFASWVTPEAALVDTVGADLARACRADH